MSDTLPPATHVDHPLWSRFLRWCTIRLKQLETPSSSHLVVESHDRKPLNEYVHTPLPNPQTYIRLVTLLPGKFDDEIKVSIQHHALTPPSSGRKSTRLNLVEVRRDLPSGWEAFQTVSSGRIFLRLLIFLESYLPT